MAITLLSLLSLLTSLLGAMLIIPTAALPVSTELEHVARASDASERLVFAHFMVRNDYSPLITVANCF
jgi:hypothetical protein